MTALPGTGFVGIATSKKIGNKPQRNRAKRRFREVLLSLKQDLNPKLDYIVVVPPVAAKASLDEIRGQLAGLVDELNRRWASELESS